jgi:hypothetical protein
MIDAGHAGSPLLPLDDVHVRDDVAQHMPLCQVVQQLLHLELEHAGHQVRAVGPMGSAHPAQLIQQLGPLWVACCCDEQAGGAAAAHDGQGVLVQLQHVARAANDGGWQDDVTADASSGRGSV